MVTLHTCDYEYVKTREGWEFVCKICGHVTDERICATCADWDREARRCKAADNPTPDEPAYPSDSCHFWGKRR
jgi:hypothetical protein